MKYLIFDTEVLAEDRSRQEWVKEIGREKLPTDVTEFFWSRKKGLDGRTALVLPDEDVDRLTQPELDLVVSELDPVNWPPPPPPFPYP